MREFLRSAAGVVGGVLLVALVLGGWFAYGMVRDSVPEPVRGLIDSVQGGGYPGYGPAFVNQPPTQSEGTDPLAACPEYAADAQALVSAAQGDDPQYSARVEQYGQVVTAEFERVSNGATPGPIEAGGVATALSSQSDALALAAERLRTQPFDTQQVASLAVSMAAALDAIVDADQLLLGDATGPRTRAQWLDYGNSVAGALGQGQAIANALAKCP